MRRLLGPHDTLPCVLIQTLLSFVEHRLTDVTISDDLKEVYNHICICLSEVGTLDFITRQALPKLIETNVVKKWLGLVNKCSHECIQSQCISLSQCDCLVYVGSMAVAKLSGPVSVLIEKGEEETRGPGKSVCNHKYRN